MILHFLHKCKMFPYSKWLFFFMKFLTLGLRNSYNLSNTRQSFNPPPQLQDFSILQLLAPCMRFHSRSLVLLSTKSSLTKFCSYSQISVVIVRQ